MTSGDPNPCPHACLASTLTTKQSPQPLVRKVCWQFCSDCFSLDVWITLAKWILCDWKCSQTEWMKCYSINICLKHRCHVPKITTLRAIKLMTTNLSRLCHAWWFCLQGSSTIPASRLDLLTLDRPLIDPEKRGRAAWQPQESPPSPAELLPSVARKGIFPSGWSSTWSWSREKTQHRHRWPAAKIKIGRK